ncbi:MAG: aminoglycoside phosphotransferase [Friedmanniella sp.]|nr:aminoglycoside phosphotransferase [Friedmanniella sp.]
MVTAYAEAIAQTFDLGVPLEPPTLAGAGEQGRLWRLVTDRGVRAVKELRRRQTREDAEADAAFQEAVLADGSVPMPRPLRTASGEVLGEVGPHQVRAYTWVELASPVTGCDLALVGSTVAALHRVPHRGGRPVSPWSSEPVGAARWADLRHRARAASAPFAEALEAEIGHLLALETVMTPPVRVQTCHRDLWADNVLPTPTGGVCIVDWENCGGEDPVRELPGLLLDFGAGDPERVRTLYAAYRDAGGPARLSEPADFTAVAAQFGHFWVAAAEEYLRPGATADEQAHALSRLAELLDPPFRVADLEALLDTVAGLG